MNKTEAIRAYIRENGPQIIADTIMLAEHQSTTAHRDYAERCADAIVELMRERLGVEPQAVFPQETRGRHLYYRIGEDAPTALMIGHYDTVWDIDAIPLKLEGNVLSGPGVYDMKYGIVAGIWAVKALIATGGLNGSVGMFFNSDEETGSRTSVGCFEPIAKTYPAVLVLEPTLKNAVKVARKSTGAFRIHVCGRAAHAGSDYTSGRSAILEAARLTEQLFAMTDLDKGTTVNVGVISGGTKSNVIASDAWMEVDVRVTTVAEGKRITAAIQALKPTQDGVVLEITGGINRPPFEFCEQNKPLFEKACAAAAELGMELRGIHVGGGSDANFTSGWGIPSLDGLGAVGDGAHAVHEHILIEESLEHTALLGVLLASM